MDLSVCWYFTRGFGSEFVVANEVSGDTHYLGGFVEENQGLLDPH